MTKSICLSVGMLVAASTLGTGIAAAAITDYDVTVNTSSLAGQAGYIDLQLEPGPTATNLVTASVMSFTQNGSLTGGAMLTGNVTGQLPGTLNFNNQTSFNDYFQGVKFGTTESFIVALNGPTPTGGGPTAFNIGFYGADGATPLLTTSSNGEAGQIVINSNGSTGVATYGSALQIQAASGPVTAPEINAGSAVSAITLLFGSLAVLLGRRASSRRLAPVTSE